MTENHPITPPPELVREWAQINGEKDLERFWMRLATQASRWGADQELEACVKWIEDCGYHRVREDLRAARRPKPPSLKAQALETLRQMHIDPETGVSPTALDTIRRALEQLDD